jgi:hypothetical protein
MMQREKVPFLEPQGPEPGVPTGRLAQTWGVIPKMRIGDVGEKKGSVKRPKSKRPCASTTAVRKAVTRDSTPAD